jgi:hypothetical protein
LYVLTLISKEMKKLGKLQINPEKLMRNEELFILRGGYGWTYCIRNGEPCANNPTGDCAGLALWFCDTYCPGWTSINCVGD